MAPSVDGDRRPAASSADQCADGRGRWGHTYAAVDLGTNNCRLLVARPSGTRFRVIDAFSRIVRLGEGVAEAERLSDAAMERTLAALAVCAGKIKRNRASRVRAVATEACRRAANRDEFFARAKEQTGIELEPIDQAVEAKLALAGCASMLDPDLDDGHALLFDIGGGSTQISWLQPARGDDGGAPEVLATCFMPCGVVTLAEKFGGHDVDETHYTAMCDFVSDRLMQCNGSSGMPNGTRAAQMIGTSGTVTTLAAVMLDLPRYDRGKIDGLEVKFDDLVCASVRLRAMSYEERAAHPCIGADRADLVIAGCAILDAIHHHWPAGRLNVADRGLRDGMLMGLMADADREAV